MGVQLLWQARFLGKENTFSLSWYIQRYLIMYLKDGPYSKNMQQKSSCLAMAFGCSPYHRVLQSFGMACLWWFSSQSTNSAAVASSLQLGISAQAMWLTGRLFTLPSQYKTYPSLSPSANQGTDGNQGGLLAFRPMCSVLSQPVFFKCPAQLERRVKETVASQESKASWGQPQSP